MTMRCRWPSIIPPSCGLPERSAIVDLAQAVRPTLTVMDAVRVLKRNGTLWVIGSYHNIYRVGAMNTGEVNLGEDIAYRVLYSGNKLHVVNTREARALAAGNPDSFLRVSRPEIDLPEGTDEHADAVYAKGAENLAELVERRVLVQDPEPRLYVYAQRMGTHRQTGLVACASVDEYDRDVIKKHEKTRADKEDDRTRHIDALSAHDEPVFLTYRASPGIDAAVAEVTAGAPEYDLTTADGVRHRTRVMPHGLDVGQVVARVEIRVEVSPVFNLGPILVVIGD